MQYLFQNKAVTVHYTIDDKLEVGMKLFGWEVKSLKHRRFNLTNAYIESSVEGELWLKNANISIWPGALGVEANQTLRPRKLLAHRKEAARIGGAAKRPGYTLVPLSMYVNDKGLVKLEIALVRGKKKYQKKEAIKRKDLRRQLEQEMKSLRY